MWYFPDFWGVYFFSVFVRVDKPDKICASFIFYRLKWVEHRLSVTLWSFWAYLECLCVLNLKCEGIKSSIIIKFNTFSQKYVCWFILVSFVTLHCHCYTLCLIQIQYLSSYLYSQDQRQSHTFSCLFTLLIFTTTQTLNCWTGKQKPATKTIGYVLFYVSTAVCGNLWNWVHIIVHRQSADQPVNQGHR